MKYYWLALGTLVAICVGCATDGPQVVEHSPHKYVAPPAAMLQRPGPMVDGPGPGVMPMIAPPPASAAVTRVTQIRFVGQTGAKLGWKIAGGYAENQLHVPGRQDFVQAATYRLKMTGLPNREGLVLYPSLQVYPAHPTTDAYLAHNTVPVELTDEDLDQIESNNFVTKVIYLPDPKFQDIAIAGVETLVSTRLDPGVDPVAEADRRGTIMVVFRVGNMDMETPGRDGGNAQVSIGPNGVKQVGYRVFDGDKNEFVPPMPIDHMGMGLPGVPSPMMVANGGYPGMPTPHPVSGMGNLPVWGQPITATPIGLPGPPHLPYGGPAGLKSHTVRNLSKNNIPAPVDHLLIDVKHKPGYSLPAPVKHIQYTEEHPVFSPGELSYPASTTGGMPGAGYMPAP